MKKKYLHKEQLGYNIPDEYFEDSKKEMLSFLSTSKTNSEQKGFSALKFGAAFATIAILIGVIFFNTKDENNKFELLTIESLEIDDQDFDQWFDENFILNEV